MKKSYLWNMGIIILAIAGFFLYAYLAEDKSSLNEIITKLDKNNLVSVRVSKTSKETRGKTEINLTDKESISNVLNKLSEIKTVSAKNGKINPDVKFTYEIAILDRNDIAVGMNFKDNKNMDVIELNPDPNKIHSYTIKDEPDVYRLLDSFIFAE
ncbi:hypothetical protein [Paenibacillus sp. P22]|uniref:hypothetical protein n=1 Tax=Paenibacillus sp. P22 TaxID=483908 RepID=UPI00039010E7|nr:hypothetical protein [Paenibacillus sp. P22]CDN43634.1 hypothetical protein BN871_DG_00080 [Paenibacillus sp. P22]